MKRLKNIQKQLHQQFISFVKSRRGSKIDDKNKEIMLIGIGNPFYIHADHIGYEDRYVFGGYIETELNLPLSLDTKAAKIILLSQDEFGLKEIKRLDLN